MSVGNYINQLKEGYPWKQLANCIRFNGQIDIYRGRRGKKISIFNNVEKSWYYPKNAEDMIDYAATHLEHYRELPKEEKISGEQKMTFGQHVGKKIKDVPASYLIWLLDNDKSFGLLREYTEQNEVALRQQKKQWMR